MVRSARCAVVLLQRVLEPGPTFGLEKPIVNKRC